MFTLAIEDNFSSAHQLRAYQGKCENLHGHNWKIILKVKGEKLNNIGLLIDFKDLKQILKKILNNLDHQNINTIYPFDKLNPSSENIAKYIFEQVEKIILQTFPEIEVDSVTVWESNTSRCTYTK